MGKLFKKLWNAFVVFVSTIIDVIAAILKIVSLVFDIIRFVIRKGSDFLTDVSGALLGTIKFSRFTAK